MEFTKEYTGKRWKIVYAQYSGLEKRAVDLVHSSLRTYTKYVPVVDQKLTAEENMILVGTSKDFPGGNEFLTVNLPEDGSYVKVMKKDEQQIVVIAGADEASCFYAAIHFVDDYLPEVRKRPVGHPFFISLFEDELPEYENMEVPTTKTRGLWTWGHVIYDYRNYLKNMARLKMNKITVWNDFAPINGKDFVEYAHSWGIRVIWGFTWGWGRQFAQLDISDLDVQEEWKKRILKVYQEQYADLGGDGIYFQTLTETKNDMINGKCRATCAVQWVNTIADYILSFYPNLRIEFGLHATSVKTHLDEIEKTDPRVSIIWEDCGAFPYFYSAANKANQEETLQLNNQIAALRSAQKFGTVFKGQSHLDWKAFENQRGPFIIGESSEEEIAEKEMMRRDISHFQRKYWVENGPFALQIIQNINSICGGTEDLVGLLEDGMFDRNIWLPAVLFAEMLWNCNRSFDQILATSVRRSYVK